MAGFLRLQAVLRELYESALATTPARVIDASRMSSEERVQKAREIVRAWRQQIAESEQPFIYIAKGEIYEALVVIEALLK